MAQTKKDYDHLFKITIIGDSGVGKSCILLRFTDDNFDEGQAVTIGVDFKTKLMVLDGKKINLTIWDTAGQEKFRSLTSSYYRGAHGIICVYDVTNRASFNAIEHWLEEIQTNCTNGDVVTLLVGNKIDMPNREVTREEAAKFARQKAMLFIECSAKTKLGVEQTFEELVQKILDTPNLWDDKPRSVLVPDTTENPQPPQCYC
eukprot:TRINITY_DN3455_c0_g1_i1.p2 TRINITY_DN3455_c0_g1~~TRINITY_DN3455_c0_g1_i1.p2  ORF type:complete len:203 (-),score=31.29 TRINITY_DN3455_c0_g1_i1:55-663(-)